MNAAIRAVVRTGYCRGMEVLGVRHGYQGLMDADVMLLRPRNVGGILQRGGTMLGSARSDEFKTTDGQKRAIENLRQNRVEALVVIGGNGSQSGAAALSALGFPVVGIGSTIDNDLYGADITIGATTALEIIVEAADRLRVTASSHQRAFLIEVMGRDCGYLALMGGIASGAEAIVIPEVAMTTEEIAAQIREAYHRGKPHALIMVAEGAQQNAATLAQYFAEQHQDLGFDLRVTSLGHVQRGGDPCVFDRLLATMLGDAATARLAEDRHGMLLAMRGGTVQETPLAELAGKKKAFDLNLLALARSLTI